MFDLNPYSYDSANYYEHEMRASRRNLDLVIAGAKNTILDADYVKGDQDFIKVCETVVVANEKYLSTVKRYEEAKAKEDKHNE